MNFRGRSTSRSTGGAFGSYHFGANAWGRSATTGTKRSGGRTARKSMGTVSESKYRTCCNSFARKIESFKKLYTQAQGPSSSNRPTPTVLNQMANWVNKGAVIQTCTPAQVTRWARNTNKRFNTRTPSTTACKTVLGAKFGKATIKAVAKSKNGQFIVATAPTCNGRPFNFPS